MHVGCVIAAYCGRAFRGFRPRRQRDRFAHRWEHCSKAPDFFEWLSARRKIWPGHYKPEVVDWRNDRHSKLARAAAWAEPLTQKWRTCECLSGGREFKPSQPFVAGSGGVDWRVLEAPTVFHRSHCSRTASRCFRSRGHLGSQPPARFRAQQLDSLCLSIGATTYTLFILCRGIFDLFATVGQAPLHCGISIYLKICHMQLPVRKSCILQL